MPSSPESEHCRWLRSHRTFPQPDGRGRWRRSPWTSLDSDRRRCAAATMKEMRRYTKRSQWGFFSFMVKSKNVKADQRVFQRPAADETRSGAGRITVTIADSQNVLQQKISVCDFKSWTKETSLLWIRRLDEQFLWFLTRFFLFQVMLVIMHPLVGSESKVQRRFMVGDEDSSSCSSSHSCVTVLSGSETIRKEL